MKSYGLFFLFVLTLLGSCSSGKEVTDEIVLETKSHVFAIDKTNTTFRIEDKEGKLILAPHPISGFLLVNDRDEELLPGTIEDFNIEGASSVKGKLSTTEGISATFGITLETDHLHIQINPESKLTMEVRTAPMSPVYGLGDHGGYEGKTNLFGFHNSHFMNDKSEKFNWNHYRFISTFAIFPAHRLAQVIFDRGSKRIAITDLENKMGVNHSDQLNAYYFFGEPKQIYRTYKRIKEREGYPDKKPKFDFFEIGYEAFGSLGWNTYQSSVQEDISTYLEKGYPIKWAVVGSGFWKGERRKPQEGSTTAFGIWDSIPGDKREDGLPNPRYPDVAGLKGFFSKRDIRLLLGSRINFKALEEDGGNYFPKNDGNFVQEGLKNRLFLTKEDGKPELFKVNFPVGNTYLLNTDLPEAVEWYVENYDKWGVDGVKEDMMLQDGVLLNNDAKLNPVNEKMMDLGKMVMVRNAAYSVPGDILRLEDTKYGFDQDRTLINALNYAFSGVGNIYPDIVAGKYLESPLSEDEKRYFVRNAMMAAVMPVMSLGYGPWNMNNQTYENIVKKAVDRHDQLVPYIYSEVVRGYETGFPYAMTPLPLAFPDDEATYHLGDSINRQYIWLIGESLLAAPLFGNDYAEAQTRDLYLPEGNWMDWETGDILEGGRTYPEYAFPDDKLPLFVGGIDCIVIRKNGQLYAYYYPLNFTGRQYEFAFSDGVSKTAISLPSEKGQTFSLLINERETGEMAWDEEHQAYFFPIETQQNYRIISK